MNHDPVPANSGRSTLRPTLAHGLFRHRPGHPLALIGVLLIGMLASTAFAANGTCQKLQDTRYWRISHPIVPMPNPEPRDTQRALEGFDMTLTPNSDGTFQVDMEVHGRADGEANETTPDKDDITVDTASQILYFLEGDMGDDAYASDTDLGDEAVVLTDLQGCILN